MNRWIRRGLIVYLVLAPFALCAGILIWLEIPFYLIGGWIVFLRRTLPGVRWNPAAIGSGVVVLVVITGLVHVGGLSFVRRIRASRSSVESIAPTGSRDHKPDFRWSFRMTTCVLASVLALFAAGLGVVGVVSHVFQMRIRERMIDDGGFSRHVYSRFYIKELAIGVSNYAGAHEGRLPKGTTFDRHGRGDFGWLVRILPFVEQTTLYQRIDFASPWDSVANRRVFSTPIQKFLDVAVDDGTNETDLGLAVTHYAANQYVLGFHQPLAMSEVSDGTSNTMLASRAMGNFRAWGDPVNARDLALGISKSANGFGSNDGGVYAAMVDGSVRFLSDKTDITVLKALATPNGGESIPEF